MKTRHRIFCKTLIPVVALLLSAACTTLQAGGGQQRDEVNHVVVVWLKPEYRTEEAIGELIAAQEKLREIPGLISLSVGRSIPSDRGVVDDSFDVATHFRFGSVEEMNEYLSHPVHVRFLEEHTRGKVEKVVIYDF